MLDSELRNLGGVEFFRANLNKQDLVKIIKTTDTSTSEILNIWSEISLEASISAIEQLKAQSLWHNSLIRVGNKPIFYRSWSVKGVKKVGHLMNDANSFLSFSDFTELYNIKTNFLTFQAILSAVKALQKSNEANFNNYNTAHESSFDTFQKSTKPSRLMYKILKSKKQKNPVEVQRKWVTKCSPETPDDIDWKAVYKTPFLCTKTSKLIVF